MGVLLVLVLIVLAVCVVISISKSNKKDESRPNNGASYDYYRHGVNCDCRMYLKNLYK